MSDRIDPTLLPFLDSEVRHLLQDGVLRIDDHKALMDEAKKDRKEWESSLEPTEEQLLAFKPSNGDACLNSKKNFPRRGCGGLTKERHSLKSWSATT
jgi:hypothetical protein